MSFSNAGDAGSGICYFEKYDRLAHILLRRYKILLSFLMAEGDCAVVLLRPDITRHKPNLEVVKKQPLKQFLNDAYFIQIGDDTWGVTGILYQARSVRYILLTDISRR